MSDYFILDEAADGGHLILSPTVDVEANSNTGIPIEDTDIAEMVRLMFYGHHKKFTLNDLLTALNRYHSRGFTDEK